MDLRNSMRGIFALCLTCDAAFGVPIEWRTDMGGNGHFYELIATPATWPEAMSAASSMTFNGVPGHLVTINDLAESAFLSTASNAWIG